MQIGYEIEPGFVRHSYCHDTDIEDTLRKHYNASWYALELVESGSLARLKDNLNTSWFYVRDFKRSPDDCKPLTTPLNDITDPIWLWKDGRWQFYPKGVN